MYLVTAGRVPAYQCSINQGHSVDSAYRLTAHCIGLKPIIKVLESLTLGLPHLKTFKTEVPCMAQGFYVLKSFHVLELFFENEINCLIDYTKQRYSV